MKITMEKRCIIHYKGFPDYTKLKELSERNKQRSVEGKKNVSNVVVRITTKSSAMVYQRHLLKTIVYTQNHVIRSSPLFQLANQFGSLKIEGRHHGSLWRKYLFGLIPMFAISAKNHAYNIRARTITVAIMVAVASSNKIVSSKRDN